MTQRLARIEWLITTLTLSAAACGLAFGIARPLGIALGGGAALLDFALLRRLGAAVVGRRTPVARLTSMALVKSVLLLGLPAAALLLPQTLVDGVSFAIGVTALPLAVVVDACLPITVVSDGR